jgi:hypothetical protein
VDVCFRRIVTLTLCLAVVGPSFARADVPEAARVRVLIVVDTDDQMGATWGLDGDNLKVVLAAGAQKQGIRARVTIDMFTGKEVTPENILAHYEQLEPAPDETLVFYYSGHGGYHLTKGHFLALRWGKLYRSALLTAMKKKQPQLIVVLTDCCSNISGGARQEEPPAQVVAFKATSNQSFPKAKRQEPPSPKPQRLEPDSIRISPPPRPNTLGLMKGKKAKQEEPPFQIVGLRLKRPLNLTLAKQEEPPARAFLRLTKGVVLTTGQGTVPLEDIADTTDGEVLRHLLFRHYGVVDINGCKQGALSHGTLQWGGSLFTIGFMALQKDKSSRFDTNNNRLVEWSEFFPVLQKTTEDAGQRATRGKIRQSPEATQLAQPAP